MRHRLWQMIILGIKQFRDPYYHGFAAQISFYLLLSIVPIFLLLTQVLGQFDLTMKAAVGWISDYTGNQVSSMLNNLMEFESAGFQNVVFIIVTLWSASRAQFAIMRITNYTFTEGRSTGRGYFRERFRAMRTMTITLFTIAFSLLILGFGDVILKAVLNALEIDPKQYLDSIWMYSRWVIGLTLYFLMVSYNYYILPSSRLPFRKIVPGSIFASVGMLLVTVVYAKYTDSSISNNDLIYGTLSSIVALLFWFFFLAWVLCLGILVNKLWADTEQYSRKNSKAIVEKKEKISHQ